MALEIERKFLLKQKFVPKHHRQEKIVQGYFLDGSGKTVRLRLIDGERGVLTLKTKVSDFIRNEFEYDIPAVDALEMLKLCKKGVNKTRFYYPYHGKMWTIDVFSGKLKGLQLAEIELKNLNDTFVKPDFIGKEVSTESSYKNSALAWSGFCEEDLILTAF